MELTDEVRSRLRGVQLELAIEFKRICEAHNLKYFLDSGTLIGAVRHKGFIPWDDDLDIGMPRDDYEKFRKIAPEELGGSYFYQDWHTDPGFGLPFAKIRKNNTCYSESTAQEVIAHAGIYIDIFPYDTYGDSMAKQGFTLMLFRRMIMLKCGYKQWQEQSAHQMKKKLIYLPIRLLSVFFSKRYLIGKYEKTAMKYNANKTLPDVFENSSANYSRWVISKSCIADTVPLLFEEVEFQCPKGYDEYLTRIYGNYMELPPIEKRISRHNIVKINFE